MNHQAAPVASDAPATVTTPSSTAAVTTLLQQVLLLSRPDQLRLSTYIQDLPDLDLALRYHEDRPALLRTETHTGLQVIIDNLSQRWNDHASALATVHSMHRMLTGTPATPEETGITLDEMVHDTEAPDDLADTQEAPADAPDSGNDESGACTCTSADDVNDTAPEPPESGRAPQRNLAWREASRHRLNELLRAGTDINTLKDVFSRLSSGTSITNTMIRRIARNERPGHLPDACYEHIWTLTLAPKPTPETTRQKLAQLRAVCKEHGVSPRALHTVIKGAIQSAQEGTSLQSGVAMRMPSTDALSLGLRHAGTLTEAELQMLIDGIFELNDLKFPREDVSSNVDLMLDSAILAATRRHLERLRNLGYDLSDLDAPMRQLGWTGPSLEAFKVKSTEDLSTMIGLLQQIDTPNPTREDRQPDVAGPKVLIQRPADRTRYINDLLDKNGTVTTNELTGPFGIHGGAAVQLLREMDLHPIQGGRYRR